jgi:hypothetical protein
MVEFGRFGTLADGRPVSGRAFDALIEASGAWQQGRAREPRLAKQDRR